MNIHHYLQERGLLWAFLTTASSGAIRTWRTTMTRRPAQTLTTMTKTRSRGSKIKLILNTINTIFVFFWSWIWVKSIQLNGSIRDMGWKSGGIWKFFLTKKDFIILILSFGFSDTISSIQTSTEHDALVNILVFSLKHNSVFDNFFKPGIFF